MRLIDQYIVDLKHSFNKNIFDRNGLLNFKQYVKNNNNNDINASISGAAIIAIAIVRVHLDMQ